VSDRIGHVIRERRLAAGLSLRCLAGATGMSTVELGEVERGQAIPSDIVLSKIFANIYEIPRK